MTSTGADRTAMFKRRAMPGVLLGWAALARAQQATSASDDPAASPRWQQIRQSLYGKEAMATPTAAELTLSAPRRAEDPAFVPMSLRSEVLPTAPGAIRRLTLIIDNNPSPVAAIFDLPPDGAWPDIETRVRVDEYSFVRAVAETSDGRVLMAIRHVKASGGCSAAAGGDEAAIAASMGRMKFRAEGAVVPGQPLTLQWMMSHPNHSGMAMNQLTRQYTPAHYVRQVRLFQGERLLLNADVDFALSENPSLRLRFVPVGDGPLRAEVTDTQGRIYTGSAALKDLS